MKTSCACFLFFILSVSSVAQVSDIDSFQQALKVAKADSNRARILWRLSDLYQPFKPDTSVSLSRKALAISRKIKFEEGEFWSLNQLGSALNQIGNYPQALEYYVEQLKIAEQTKNVSHITTANINIASIFARQGDNRKAVSYSIEAEKIIDANKLQELRFYNCNNLGDMYEKLNILDSAMYFTNIAYEIAKGNNDDYLVGVTLNNLANVCSKNGKTDLAFKNYRKALPYLEGVKAESYISETFLGLAKLFDHNGQKDSALYYAKKSYDISKDDNFLNKNLSASVFLAAFYKKEKNIDSAFKYQEQMLLMKDSIFSAESIKQSLVISTTEQLRQQELKEKKMKEAEDLKKIIQLTAAGVILPFVFLLIVFIRRQKIKPRLVEFAGIISLLLFFECLTLLLHPVVQEKAHHNPIVELLVFVIIASILSPSHHRIQHWLLGKLSYKKSYGAK